MRRASLRRALALWLVLFGVYAATVDLDAFDGSNFGGDEPHYLLTAKSLVDDRSPDLLDEYRTRDYDEIYSSPLQPRGALTRGLLNEPLGLAFPLLIAPAYAVGGATLVELFLAAIAALTVVLAYALALRVVPDPWALAAAVLAGLSPPFVGFATAVFPAMPGAAALAGATLLALRFSTVRSRIETFGCFTLLGTLPWLNPPLVVPGAVIAVFAVRDLWSRRRRMLAIGGMEVTGFSLAFFASLNEGLYGGLTPYAAQITGESATGAHSIADHAERAHRIVGLWIDREVGVLRWAPLFALAFVGLWLAWRERRAGLARVIPELRLEETAAALCAAVVGAQLFVAVFLAPTINGFWFPGRHLIPVLPLLVPLVALGLRRVPRLGALLGAIGIAASVWLYVDVRWGGGGLAQGRPDAPWGPLEAAWPSFEDEPFASVLAAIVFAVLCVVFLVDERVWRRLAGRVRVGVLLLAVAVAGAGAAAAPDRASAARVEVGRSADGRAITASRLGDPAAARKVLVVGAIHGDERGGLAVTRSLRADWARRIEGADVWVVDAFNPDGLARGRRGNSRGVDLNRNFPYRWRRSTRGTRYWGGSKPLSEPETRAIRRLVLELRPAVTIWYHQPWGAVLACGDGIALQRRYARLAGMGTSCRGRGLPGTATSWQNNVVGGGTAFVVELAGGTVSGTTARRHARAAAIVAEGP